MSSYRYCIMLMFAVLVGVELGLAQTADMQLGRELLREGNVELAAVEFRRAEMDASLSLRERSSALLFSAGAYLRGTEYSVAAATLDRVEDRDEAGVFASETALLYVELHVRQRAWEEAGYFLDLIDERDDSYRTYVARRRAQIAVQEGDLLLAQSALQASPLDERAGLAGIHHYRGGRDRSPRLGGLLGMLPGVGYWYSGEFANGLRSLILNGLFMYGMADTAAEEQWGAFSVITFFEFTWYSGSIYGGIDAAHRYNDRRLQRCLDAIEGDMDVDMDTDVRWPLFELRFAF